MPERSDSSDKLVKMWADKSIDLVCPICKSTSFSMMENGEIEIPFGTGAIGNDPAYAIGVDAAYAIGNDASYAMYDQASYAVDCTKCGFVMSFRKRVVDASESASEPGK